MSKPPESLLNSAPEGTHWFGGPVDRSRVTLRIIGEGLDEKEISILLGHEPTKTKTQRTNSWRLRAPESTPGDLDSQINWILSRLTQDLAIWETITSRNKAEFFIGLFLDAGNRGITISPATLSAVAARRVAFGFDIYAEQSEDAEQD